MASRTDKCIYMCLNDRYTSLPILHKTTLKENNKRHSPTENHNTLTSRLFRFNRRVAQELTRAHQSMEGRDAIVDTRNPASPHALRNTKKTSQTKQVIRTAKITILSFINVQQGLLHISSCPGYRVKDSRLFAHISIFISIDI